MEYDMTMYVIAMEEHLNNSNNNNNNNLHKDNKAIM